MSSKIFVGKQKRQEKWNHRCVGQDAILTICSLWLQNLSFFFSDDKDSQIFGTRKHLFNLSEDLNINYNNTMRMVLLILFFFSDKDWVLESLTHLLKATSLIYVICRIQQSDHVLKATDLDCLSCSNFMSVNQLHCDCLCLHSYLDSIKVDILQNV